jgi:Glyoxalase/Bleomycin resistance protein/Dioxygenase superfamily
VLAWGQPLGAIVQFAYFVDDIDEAILRYVAQLGVGPWFLRGPFQPPDGRYRGRPTTPTFSVARAFAGHTMLELVAQHDDGPSVYREHGGPRYGFHHWAIITTAFDDDLARYAAHGYDEAFSDRLPSGSRVAYVDSTRDLPGMIELVEHTDAQERVYAEIFESAVGWDGRDPIRREG